jgi:hypothetical protein
MVNWTDFWYSPCQKDCQSHSSSNWNTKYYQHMGNVKEAMYFYYDIK